MILNCLIVDDEPLARAQIGVYADRIPFLKVVGSVRNPQAAQAVLHTQPVDLIFLDIQMPQMTGVDFLRQNNIFQQVIFITAYPEFAIDGFELEVTDYLVKPVTFERFLKACNKALAKVSGSTAVKTITSQPDFLYIKCNQRFEKIWVKDILFIESMLNYVNIFAAAKKYTVYSSLKAFEGSLPADDFIRIHKSYLVARQHISMIDGHKLKVNEHTLPISRANRQVVLQAIARSSSL